MASTVQHEPPRADDLDGVPRAGVIADARRRRRVRRRAVAAALIALLGAAVSGWLLGGSGGKSDGPRNRPAIATKSLFRRAPTVRIEPGLEGGSYGWAVLIGSSGSCCTVPQKKGGRIAITPVSWEGDKREEAATVFLPRGVGSVRVAGEAAVPQILARFSYGFDLAQIRVARSGQRVLDGSGPPIAEFDRHGRLVGTFAQNEPLPVGMAQAAWWRAPARVPAGPCELHSSGLSALQPEWGHVATAIRPFPGVVGRAFFSCVDTEYYLHGWPLIGAILLDAGRPGRLPAAIPEMKPVPHSNSIFSAPGEWHGPLVAERRGHAWLVVAGGSSLRQRLLVLRHLIPIAHI